MLDALFGIGDLLKAMVKLFIIIIQILPKVLEIALEVLQPFNFIKDVIFGIIVGIEKLLIGIVDIISGKMNSAGGNKPGLSGLFNEGVLGSNK